MPESAEHANDQVDAVSAAIGSNIRAFRESLGWSAEHLAERAGTSRQRIFRIEEAKVNGTIATLVPIADALGVGLQDLVPGGSGAATHAARVKTAMDELRQRADDAERAGKELADAARKEAEADARKQSDEKIKQLEGELRELRRVVARSRRTASKLVDELGGASE